MAEIISPLTPNSFEPKKAYNWVIEIEGIAGIGLTILDYLADYDTNWDECLMIS